MVGGRPPKEAQKRHPELEELATWFAQAVEEAGYPSLNAVVRAEVAHKNVVYGVINAAQLYPLLRVKAFAVALGREATEVEPLWIRAKEAMDRAAEAERQAKVSPITSWADVPQPSLSLKTLLEAQARAVERLPYELLGVEEPPLSAVYVRQRVRVPGIASSETTERQGGEPLSNPDHTTEALRVEAGVPVREALNRHEHLLITGEPGAGKSTLTSHLAWTLARVWLHRESSLSAPLTEPVLPVRFAAHTLVGDSVSWGATLDRAVRLSLGASLIADPAPWLFQGRVNGVRWLILLDGLDEITDQDARRGVIRSIAQHARAEGDYRFVITSRPIPEAELLPLRTAGLGEYKLESFGSEELREFASKWFTAQFKDVDRAHAAADRFLQETDDSRLRELVRNPLLATIAAVNATLSPSRPLPVNRVSLYQSFFARLLDQGTAADRARRSALQQRLRDDPDRLELHRWLGHSKRAVLGILGRHRLDDEGPLLEAAVAWIRDHAPTFVERVPDWEADVPDFLRSTGLLVSEKDGFRFLHHSFAEYFAAENRAAAIPPDFPDAESWLWRAFQGGDHTLAVFTLCLWANRKECDPGLLAERLLSVPAGGHRRPLLAGLLLAEGVRFDELHSLRTVERLTDIACFTWMDTYQAQAFEVLGSLGDVPTVADRLEDIARSPLWPMEPRLLAMQAFSRFGPLDVAEELLDHLLAGLLGWVNKAAQIACTLGPRAREAVRLRALEVMEDPGCHHWVAGTAVEALAQLDLAEDVQRLAPVILRDLSVRAQTIRKAAESWLTTAPPENRHRVAASIVASTFERPVHDAFGYKAAGEALEKFGEIEAAAEIAGRLLASDPTWSAPVEWAASVLVKAYGAKAQPELTEALERSSADSGGYPWVPGKLHASLSRLGAHDNAYAWAKETLGHGGTYVAYADSVVPTWLAAGGQASVDAMMEYTERGRLVLAFDRPAVAQALFDAAAPDEAGEVAELALRTPNGIKSGYETAARVLVKIRGAEATEQLLEIWESTPRLALNSNWLLGVMTVLLDCEEQWDRLLPVIGELGRSLVDLPAADGDAIMEGIRALFLAEGAEAIPLATSRAQQRSWLTWKHVREIADECTALGHRDATLTLWRHILRHTYLSSSTDLALLTDIEAAGVTAEAAVWIGELLEEDALPAPRIRQLRQFLAWLEEGERNDAGPSPNT